MSRLRRRILRSQRRNMPLPSLAIEHSTKILIPLSLKQGNLVSTVLKQIRTHPDTPNGIIIIYDVNGDEIEKDETSLGCFRGGIVHFRVHRMLDIELDDFFEADIRNEKWFRRLHDPKYLVEESIILLLHSNVLPVDMIRLVKSYLV